MYVVIVSHYAVNGMNCWNTLKLYQLQRRNEIYPNVNAAKAEKMIQMGNVNNQNFVNIPYGEIRQKLAYLCELYGIEYYEQEESYTSKASFWDKDEMPIYNADNPQKYEFSGSRIHGGLYRTNTGFEFNADVNGALNILRKSNVVSLLGLYSRGGLATPVRIRLIRANFLRTPCL